MKTLTKYQNGNSNIILFKDGTRIISSLDNTLNLKYPLNLDVRVSSKCSNGYNPKTHKTVCEFCHESATTDGKECDYRLLQSILEPIDAPLELAIGINHLSPQLQLFLEWCKDRFIVNATVNQLHLKDKIFSKTIKFYIENNLLYGLGISRRNNNLIDVDNFGPNTVIHLIAGIDDIEEIIETDYPKILVLGYKTFGFGIDYLNDEVKYKIKRWKQRLPLLFGERIVSFDNLAIEQLEVCRFLNKEEWNTFYQGENSFYINAVEQYFAPNSRTLENKKLFNEMNILEYWEYLNNENKKY